MAVERTLVILKPDAVQRGLTGEIIGRLEQRGLKIVGLDMRTIDRESRLVTMPSTRANRSTRGSSTTSRRVRWC